MSAVDGAIEKLTSQIEAQRAEMERFQADFLAWQQIQAERNAQQNAILDTMKEMMSNMAESLRLKVRKTLSVAEAAKYANQAPATIRRWLADGKLKGVKRGDQKQSRWGVRRRDLDVLLERNVNQSTQTE